MDFGQNQESLWIATSNSSIKNWSFKAPEPNSSLNDRSPNNLGKKSNPIKAHNKNNIASVNQVEVASSVDDNVLSSSMNDQSNKSDISSLSSSFMMQSPLNSEPLVTIKGFYSITLNHLFQILTNKKNTKLRYRKYQTVSHPKRQAYNSN